MKTALALLALLTAAVHAEIPKPDRVLKLWDGKPPGEFTVPGPETLTPSKPTDKLPIARLYPAADATDKVSCRPDFLMLCYAWHILANNSLTELKPEIHITAKTPPTFLAQAYDDPASLSEGSALAFLALRKAKVSAELHIYSTGGHGFGMRANETQAPGDFPGRLELWLKARGLMAK
jgi:acetyl esterase/lipase